MENPGFPPLGKAVRSSCVRPAMYIHTCLWFCASQMTLRRTVGFCFLESRILLRRNGRDRDCGQHKLGTVHDSAQHSAPGHLLRKLTVAAFLSELIAERENKNKNCQSDTLQPTRQMNQCTQHQLHHLTLSTVC